MNALLAMFYVVNLAFCIIVEDNAEPIDIIFKSKLSTIIIFNDGYARLVALYVALNMPSTSDINEILQLKSFIANISHVDGLMKSCPSDRMLLERAIAVNCSNSYNALLAIALMPSFYVKSMLILDSAYDASNPMTTPLLTISMSTPANGA